MGRDAFASVPKHSSALAAGEYQPHEEMRGGTKSFPGGMEIGRVLRRVHRILRWPGHSGTFAISKNYLAIVGDH